jgi:hypothetical protein
MNKSGTIFAIGAAILLSGSSVRAESLSVPPATTTTSITNTTTTQNQMSAQAVPALPHRNGLGKKLAGIVAGVFVGTAANDIRKPVDEEKLALNDLGGAKKQNPKFTVPFGIFWAPFAGVQGLLEAPFYALDNALVHSDAPFSKQQLSLEKTQPVAPAPQEYHGVTDRPPALPDDH